MTIETQVGTVHYRISPRSPFVIEVQLAPRLRWRVHRRYRTADEATAALLRLARGDKPLPDYDVTHWQDADGNIHWSED